MSDTGKLFERGPYLSAAFLCEKVLEEKDGVKSAIRIIDRITRTQISPNPSMDMEPFDYSVVLLLKFKSGWARGIHTIKIQIVKPSGESAPEVSNNVLFEGEEDRGIDIVANMMIKLDQTGIYWIHIYLNNEKITQIPLRVIYMPQVRPMRGGNPLQE